MFLDRQALAEQLCNDRIGAISGKFNMRVGPRILLIDTNRWPLVARVAIVLRNMGCAIAVACPTPCHPAQEVDDIKHVYHYSGTSPIQSLRRAIGEFDPAIVIPFCDRSVGHLHTLHAVAHSGGGDQTAIATLIEQSLGDPKGFAVVSSRARILELAEQEGIRIPETIAIDRQASSERWSGQFKFPAVLKADGTWGGQGVRVVRNAHELQQLLRTRFARRSTGALIRQVLLNHGYDWAVHDWSQPARPVVLQQYIDGRPANCSVVCWKGEVLAGVAVEVLQSGTATGPATAVRVISGEEMLAVAGKIARRLTISGLFGLDFMIDSASGHSYLIEMNPRCTPPCHLPLAGGRNLLAAYYERITGISAFYRPAPITQLIIEYAPGAGWANDPREWERNPDVYYDIPEDEPALLRRMQSPFPRRTLLGKMADLFSVGSEQALNEAVVWTSGAEASNTSGNDVAQR